MKQTNSEIKRGMIRATKKDRMENRELFRKDEREKLIKKENDTVNKRDREEDKGRMT